MTKPCGTSATRPPGKTTPLAFICAGGLLASMSVFVLACKPPADKPAEKVPGEPSGAVEIESLWTEVDGKRVHYLAAGPAEGHEVVDFGTYDEESCDLSDFVLPASLAVARGECDRGIFVDGVGYGSAMIANKCRGVFACPNSWPKTS